MRLKPPAHVRTLILREDFIVLLIMTLLGFFPHNTLMTAEAYPSTTLLPLFVIMSGGIAALAFLVWDGGNVYFTARREHYG
jgi:hypothetical protein